MQSGMNSCPKQKCWIEMVFRETRLEVEDPIRKQGIQFHEVEGAFLTLQNDRRDQNNLNVHHQALRSSTVVLGLRPDDTWGAGSAEWNFKIPTKLLKSAIEVFVRISASRYHAGLHSPRQHNQARVSFEGQLVQELFTDAKMPNGIDYQFDRIITCTLDPINLDVNRACTAA